MRSPHPFALIYPPYSDAERAALRESIEKEGQIHSVLLAPDGRVADGWHRYQIMRIDLQIPEEQVWTEDWAGSLEGLWQRVDSLNRARRHMNKAQRACAAVSYMEASREAGLANVSRADRAKLSEMFRTSTGYIGQALALRNSYSDIFKQVSRGQKKLSEMWRWSRDQKRPAGSVSKRGTAPDAAKPAITDRDIKPENRETKVTGTGSPPHQEPPREEEVLCDCGSPPGFRCDDHREPPTAPSPRAYALQFTCTDDEDDLGPITVRVEVSSPLVRVGCPICLLSLDHPVARDRHQVVKP